jgi:hypothetical protein
MRNVRLPFRKKLRNGNRIPFLRWIENKFPFNSRRLPALQIVVQPFPVLTVRPHPWSSERFMKALKALSRWRPALDPETKVVFRISPQNVHA